MHFKESLRPCVIVVVSLFVLLAACRREVVWKKNVEAADTALEQGQYAEAEDLFLSALEKAEHLGEGQLATSLSHLGGLYHTQGEYRKAEPFYKRALAILEKALGPKHPYVATSLSNLADLYRAQGKYGHAESLHRLGSRNL